VVKRNSFWSQRDLAEERAMMETENDIRDFLTVEDRI